MTSFSFQVMASCHNFRLCRYIFSYIYASLGTVFSAFMSRRFSGNPKGINLPFATIICLPVAIAMDSSRFYVNKFHLQKTYSRCM